MSESQGDQSTKKHLRGSSLLLAGRMISLLTNFLVQVLIVRYLSKEGYGAFAYGYSIVSIARRMTPLGTDKAVSRFVPIYHERQQLAKLKGSLIVVTLTIVTVGLLLTGLVFSCKSLLSGTLVRDPLSVSVLIVIISLAPLDATESMLEKWLAIFGRVKSIFFRRYLVTPSLRLIAVCSLMLAGGDAVFLAAAYVVATLIGILITARLLWNILCDDDLLGQIRHIRAEYPIKRLFSFGVPLLSSDVVFGLRESLAVLLLEFFHGTSGVAAFRAVRPVARLNYTAFDSFQMLFVPTASRLLAKGDTEGINQLYWRSSAWVSLLTFPVLLISFSLASPVVVLLFGESYASSGPVLSLLALGLYLNAAFGFNASTLQVFNRVGAILRIDFAIAILALVVNLMLVPYFGPMGAAGAACLVLVFQNAAYQAVLFRSGQLSWIPREIGLIHGSILVLAMTMLFIQSWVSPPVLVSLSLSLVVTVALWTFWMRTLQIRELFPELDRFLPKRLRLGQQPKNTHEPSSQDSSSRETASNRFKSEVR